MKKDSCLLCQIVDNQIPSHIIYEDDVCVAVLDINGASLGHSFVIPKNHHPILEQVPDTELTHLFSVANKISGMLFEKLQTIQGTNIYVANGIPAGQRVAHFMIHVIPRVEGDGINLQWQPKQLSEEEMSTVELKLKDQIKNTGVVQQPSSAPSPVAASESSAPASYDADDEDDYFMDHVNKIPRG